MIVHVPLVLLLGRKWDNNNAVTIALWFWCCF